MVEKWIKEHYNIVIKEKKKIVKEVKKTVNKEKRNEFLNKKVICCICKTEYTYTNKIKHISTKKHLTEAKKLLMIENSKENKS